MTLDDLHNIFLREREAYAEWSELHYYRAAIAIPNQTQAIHQIAIEAAKDRAATLRCSEDFYARNFEGLEVRAMKQLWKAAKAYTLARDEGLPAAMLWKLANDD